MGLIETGVAVAKALVPPKTNDLEDQQRWRWVVFAALIGLTTTLTIHILLACGFLTSIYPGFALASDAQQIQHRVDVIAALSLEHAMRDKAGQICQEKETGRRSQLNDELSRLQRDYYDIWHFWYLIPTCERL